MNRTLFMAVYKVLIYFLIKRKALKLEIIINQLLGKVG